MHPSCFVVRGYRRAQRFFEIRHPTGEISQATPNDPSEQVELDDRDIVASHRDLCVQRVGDIEMLASFHQGRNPHRGSGRAQPTVDGARKFARALEVDRQFTRGGTFEGLQRVGGAPMELAAPLQ